MSFIRFTFTFGLMLTCLASIASAQDFDVIFLHDGSPKQGEITAMSNKMVAIDRSGIESEIELDNLKRITFGDEPNAVKTARTNIANGQFEDAVTTLKGIDADSIQRKIVRDEVSYMMAFAMSKMALAGSGDKTASARAMAPFANNTGSYHYYEANEIMGDLATGLNRADSAAEYYQKVGAAPWPDFKMRAFVLEGQALVAQEKYQEAYKKFNTVVSANLNTPMAARQKEFATLGRAICLAAAGKPQDGINDVNKIIKDGDSRDAELFSRAYNALGKCHLKANNQKDALLAYLHVDLLFFQDPAQHAEALYHLRKLWSDTGKQDRALQARTLLRERYSGSPWASKE